jgi:hypothetical protein
MSLDRRSRVVVLAVVAVALVLVCHYLGTLGTGVTVTTSVQLPTSSGAFSSQVGEATLAFKSPTLTSLEMLLVWFAALSAWTTVAIRLLRPTNTK